MYLAKIYLVILVLFTQSVHAQKSCLNALRNTLTPARRVLSFSRDKYKSYRKYSRPDVFARKKRDLLNKIEYWARVAERDIRLKYQRKAK